MTGQGKAVKAVQGQEKAAMYLLHGNLIVLLAVHIAADKCLFA